MLDATLVRKFVGDGVAKLVERFLVHTGGEEAYHSLFHDACQTYLELFAEFCMDGVAPYSGMAETLRVLHETGMRLGVLTNKPQERAEENIFGFFGTDIFDAVCGITAERRPKPDAAALLAILRQWEIAPDHCLYVGDTNTDMQTAQNAGMPKAGALWGFRGREELARFQPEFLLKQPLEILSVLGLT